MNPSRELLDAAALVGHLVPAGSVYAFLAEHRSQFSPMRCSSTCSPSTRGRPSQPAERVVTVLVLQSLEDLSDREIGAGGPIGVGGSLPVSRSMTRVSIRRFVNDALATLNELDGVVLEDTQAGFVGLVCTRAVHPRATATRPTSPPNRPRGHPPAGTPRQNRRRHRGDMGVATARVSSSVGVPRVLLTYVDEQVIVVATGRQWGCPARQKWGSPVG